MPSESPNASPTGSPSVAAEKGDSQDERKEAAKRAWLVAAGPEEAISQWASDFLGGLPKAGIEGPPLSRRAVEADFDQELFVKPMTGPEMSLIFKFIFQMEELNKLRKADTGPATFAKLAEMPDPRETNFFKNVGKEYPFHCSSFGVRFQQRNQLAAHLDNHFKRQAEFTKRLKGAESRGWFIPAKEWVGSEDALAEAFDKRQGEDTAPKAPGAGADRDDEIVLVEELHMCPFDEMKTECPLCGEALATEWRPKLGARVFRDAVACEVDSTEPVYFLLPTQDARKYPNAMKLTAKSAALGLPVDLFAFHRACFATGNLWDAAEIPLENHKPANVGEVGLAAPPRPSRRVRF